MNDLLLLLSLVGTTLIVVSGEVLKPVRKIWPAFFGCAQCVGFWVGLGFGVSGLITTPYGRTMDALIVGTAGSGLSFLAYAVILALLGERNEDDDVVEVEPEKGETP